MSFKEDKLKSTFLEEINSFLSKRQDLKEIAFITITDLEIVDEGRTINVYFSLFNDEQNSKIDEIQGYLETIVPQIREIIRKRVKTRFVPNIYFKYDNTPQKASRIEEILRKIESERNNASKDKGS